MKILLSLLAVGVFAQSDNKEFDELATKSVVKVCDEEIKSKDLKLITACSKGFTGGVNFGLNWAADELLKSKAR